MDTQISNFAMVEVDENERKPISKDGGVEPRTFSTDFMCKVADDLSKAIDDLFRASYLEDVKKCIDDLVFLHTLISLDPNKFVPDGPAGYNYEVSELLGAVSWDIYKLRKLAGKKYWDEKEKPLSEA